MNPQHHTKLKQETPAHFPLYTKAQNSRLKNPNALRQMSLMQISFQVENVTYFHEQYHIGN